MKKKVKKNNSNDDKWDEEISLQLLTFKSINRWDIDNILATIGYRVLNTTH